MLTKIQTAHKYALAENELPLSISHAAPEAFSGVNSVYFLGHVLPCNQQVVAHPCLRGTQKSSFER